MNLKFNAKLWIVGLMFVGAQAANAMEEAVQTQDKIKAEPKASQAPKKPDVAPQKVEKQTEKPAPKQETSSTQAPAGTPPADAPKGDEKDAKNEAGMFASAFDSIKNAMTNTKTLASNMVAFSDKNRMLTALTLGVPAAIALAYSYAPTSVKRHWLYKKIKNEVPGFVKAGLVTAVPAAIWLWYYCNAEVVSGTVAAVATATTTPA